MASIVAGHDPEGWAAAIDRWVGRESSSDPETISGTVRAAYDVPRKGQELLAQYERLIGRDSC